MAETESITSTTATVIHVDPIVPGSRVWILDEYCNAVAERTVKSMKSTGVSVRDGFDLVDWGRVFRTQEAAVTAMLARAEFNITAAEKKLKNERVALTRLRRKYGR